MRIPITEEKGTVTNWIDYNSITVNTRTVSQSGSGDHTFRCSAGSDDSYVVTGPSGATNVRVTSAYISGVSSGRTVSYSGNRIVVKMGSGSAGVTYTTDVRYSYTYDIEEYISPYTFTTRPHSGKMLESAGVYGKDAWIDSVDLDYTPDTLNGTVKVTVNFPSGAATHGTVAEVDIRISEYELEEVAKVKFNGVVYKHIKFNGQVVV